MDSEHCAVHQCLSTTDGPTTVARLVLTASGGPFRGWSADRLAAATIADAVGSSHLEHGAQDHHRFTLSPR